MPSCDSHNVYVSLQVGHEKEIRIFSAELLVYLLVKL